MEPLGKFQQASGGSFPPRLIIVRARPQGGKFPRRRPQSLIPDVEKWLIGFLVDRASWTFEGGLNPARGGDQNAPSVIATVLTWRKARGFLLQIRRLDWMIESLNGPRPETLISCRGKWCSMLRFSIFVHGNISNVDTTVRGELNFSCCGLSRSTVIPFCKIFIRDRCRRCALSLPSTVRRIRRHSR